MMIRRLVAVVGAAIRLLLTFCVVDAHVRWVDPAARPADDVKSYPCGTHAAPWATGPVTVLQPGLNQVVFDEFVCHSGDMVRIALSMGSDDDYDEHVLLDRLPHNDLCGTSANNWMAVNITIPNVDCAVENECSLQIIQIMASKFRGSSCANPSQISQQCGGDGRMYYSCARVAIAGTAPILPAVFNDFYGAESPVDYEWPLTADWCRGGDDDDDEPWQVCGTTRQASFDDDDDDESFTSGSIDPATTAVPISSSAAPMTFAPSTRNPTTKAPTSVPTASISITDKSWSPSLSSTTLNPTTRTPTTAVPSALPSATQQPRPADDAAVVEPWSATPSLAPLEAAVNGTTPTTTAAPIATPLPQPELIRRSSNAPWVAANNNADEESSATSEAAAAAAAAAEEDEILDGSGGGPPSSSSSSSTTRIVVVGAPCFASPFGMIVLVVLMALA